MKRLRPEELTERHLREILRGMGDSVSAPTIPDLVKEILSGKSQVWELDGGVLVTSVWEGQRGRVLEVGYAAGVGLIGQTKRIARELRSLAKSLGAEHIYWISRSPALDRVYSRVAKPIGTVFLMEVDDGRIDEDAGIEDRDSG